MRNLSHFLGQGKLLLQTDTECVNRYFVQKAICPSLFLCLIMTDTVRIFHLSLPKANRKILACLFLTLFSSHKNIIFQKNPLVFYDV